MSAQNVIRSLLVVNATLKLADALRNSTNVIKSLDKKILGRVIDCLAFLILREKIMDRILFLRKFIDEPKKIGSLTPSSRFLVKKMLNNLPWENFSHIAELGAGTGTFTEQIIKQKPSDCKFLVIEQDYSMRHSLEKKYPDLYFDSFAENLSASLQDMDFPSLDCVISGLPFANMPESLRKRIINNVYSSLKKGGVFVMFQYSLQMRKMLNEYFSSVDTEFFLLNFPPAFVYVCRK